MAACSSEEGGGGSLRLSGGSYRLARRAGWRNGREDAQSGHGLGPGAIRLELLERGVVEALGELHLGEKAGDLLIGLLALHLMRGRMDELRELVDRHGLLSESGETESENSGKSAHVIAS